MPAIMVDYRFCGPPNSGNGGYVCGLLANIVGEDAEITLRAPPPLGRRLDIVPGRDGGVDLRDGETLVATGRPASLNVSNVPTASFSEAQDAVRRTPYDENNHKLPTCFVCGPARTHGDGLRIFAGPLALSPERKIEAFAASWVPYANLAGDDGRVAAEFIWASLDCPTAYAALGARDLGMSGDETMLLGRMSARISERPKPGEPCVIIAWPIGRDGRKLFADSALLGSGGQVLAVARTTWLMVDRSVQLGRP